MAKKFLNADTDDTLGGSSASDTVIPSQKAVKSYTDATKEELLTKIEELETKLTALQTELSSINFVTIG